MPLSITTCCHFRGPVLLNGTECCYMDSPKACLLDRLTCTPQHPYEFNIIPTLLLHRACQPVQRSLPSIDTTRCNENGSTSVYQLLFTINQNHPLPTRIQTHTHTQWYSTHRTENKQHSVTIGLCCHHRIYGSTQAHRRTPGCASPYPSSGIYPRRRRNGWVKRPIKSRSPYTDTRSRTGDSERNNQHLNNNKRWRPAMQNPTA